MRRITFAPSAVRQLSPDTFEIELASKEGCKSVTTIKRQNNLIFQESIKLISPAVEVCGYKSSTIIFPQDGSQAKVTENDSSTSLTTSLTTKINNEDSATTTYTDSTGKTQTREVKLPQKSEDKNLPFPPHNSLCDALKAFCEGVENLSEILFVPDLLFGEALAAIPLYEALNAGLTIASFGCWIMEGGLPPIPTLKNPFDKAIYFLAGEIKGKNPVPGVDEGLANLRKQFNLDACDKKPGEPTISLTVTGPNPINVNQITTLQVTYTDPACKVRSVWVKGYGGLTNSTSHQVVPPESACSGTFKFGVINREFFGCKDTEVPFGAEIMNSPDIVGVTIASTQTPTIVKLIGTPGGFNRDTPCQAVPADPQ